MGLRREASASCKKKRIVWEAPPSTPIKDRRHKPHMEKENEALTSSLVGARRHLPQGCKRWEAQASLQRVSASQSSALITLILVHVHVASRKVIFLNKLWYYLVVEISNG